MSCIFASCRISKRSVQKSTEEQDLAPALPDPGVAPLRAWLCSVFAGLKMTRECPLAWLETFQTCSGQHPHSRRPFQEETGPVSSLWQGSCICVRIPDGASRHKTSVFLLPPSLFTGVIGYASYRHHNRF